MTTATDMLLGLRVFSCFSASGVSPVAKHPCADARREASIEPMTSIDEL